MLLQRLAEYADRIDPTPTMYEHKPVRYLIELDADGRLSLPELVDTADPSTTRAKRGKVLAVPNVQRSGTKAPPLLLCDNAQYVLGLSKGGGDPSTAARCHDEFIRLVERCAESTELPLVRAVLRFLRSAGPRQLREAEDIDQTAWITFRVDGEIPVQSVPIQEFWAKEVALPEDSPRMQCLVCGSIRPVLSRAQLLIKRVPGGQYSGVAMISANAGGVGSPNAFESYGLENSLIAPVCERDAERFTKAASSLLADDARSVRFDNIAYVFWTREPEAEFSFGPMITQPTATQVKELYESTYKAREGATKAVGDDSAFYAAALSGSGGRAVVRDWIDTTVGKAKAHLARWFDLQRITAGADVGDPLSLRQIAEATMPRRRGAKHPDQPPPNITRSLLRTALMGGPLPHDLLYQAVRRNRAERSVTRQRAALIKMVLLSRRPEFTQEEMVELDTSEGNAAYRCGRLLAVLESIQRRAIGVETVVDRFYGTASSAPASVFGRLMRGAQPHLSKLERDNRGAWVTLQRRVEEVTEGMEAFPRTLTLEEQGLFALGYYHERAQRWAGHKSGAAPDDDTETGTATIDETEE